MADSPAARSEDNFSDDSRGWAQRWAMEFKAARDEHREWQKAGAEIVERYLDKRHGKNVQDNIDTRWNFYSANVQTQEAMLYGKVPSVDVRARFADAPDSAARIAGELLERVLNSDIERSGDGYATALGLCLKDRLNPGVGFLRFRYVSDFTSVDALPAKLGEDGRELAPEVPAYEEKAYEEVETDYIHWRDVLWSPCRTFHEMRWCAFRAQLSLEQLKKKFGEDVARTISLATKKGDAGAIDAKKADPWARADVWEIEDKEHHCKWYWVEGHPVVLQPKELLESEEANENGSIEDALELEGFWSFPRPMVANLTTSAFLPRADFTLYQDLYDEIDRVSTRITEIERAIGVKGAYDKNSPEIRRLLEEASNNQLLPVENWAAFTEKGGFKGAFDLLPLDGIVAGLGALREYRNELIQSLYQLTGMSDIMRGQATDVGATATEQSIKARFASVRMQALQDEFARFASDAQRIRAEIIAKHFEPQTILERSNIQHSFDAESPGLLMQAIALIQKDVGCYRIEVKSEAISMADYAQLKSERTDLLGALSQFFQAAQPIATLMPGSQPYLLKVLQWAIEGFRGATTIAGVFDQAIAHAEQAAAQPQAAQPPPPDPRLLAAQQKAQADMQKTQQETQSELVRMQAETQQLAIRKANDARVNVMEEAAKQRIKSGGVAPLPPPVPGGSPV